jgi:hypothetical protein
VGCGSHTAQGGSGATVQGARCRGARRKTGGAGGVRRVRCDHARCKVQGRMTRGRSIPFGRTDVLIGALPFLVGGVGLRAISCFFTFLDNGMKFQPCFCYYSMENY